MKKWIIFLMFIVFINNTIAQETRYNLLFKHGQTELTEEQKGQISNIARSIKDGARVMVYPLVYDSIFDHLVYEVNAKDQASEIVKFAKTIGFELLRTPVNFPSTYRGRSVGVNMKYNKPKNIVTPDTEPKIVSYSLKNHYPEKPSQYFIINPNKDTLIVVKEGTKLFFEAGSLMSTQKVQIELKEFYSLEDYMKSGLPSVSNGKMIETGGCIYLNATKREPGGQQVNINPNKGIGTDFRLGKDDPKMQIFVKDPRSTNKMNWILPPKRMIKEDWEMTETILDINGKSISQKKYTSKVEWEQHVRDEERQAADAKRQLEKEQREAAEEQRKEAIRSEMQAKIQNKMDSKLKVYNLGYINCDKFFNEAMSPFTIAADEKTSAEYYLIYNDIRGVMKGIVNNSKVEFGVVPSNRKATLIAVSFIDKQAYYDKCTILSGSIEIPKIALKPVDESFLNHQLSLFK